MDQVLLFCFHYDAAVGRYASAAMNLMRLGRGVCALVLALCADRGLAARIVAAGGSQRDRSS